MKILFILIIIIALYLFLIAPNKDEEKKKRVKSFEENLIAHRGLFNNKDIPENSLKAFKKAVEHDYGIELDVQKTKDDILVVFHDATLTRMTGVDGKIPDWTYEELQKLNLINTDEKIPLFKDVLDVLKEETPLVVEIKPEGDYIATCEAAVEMLQTYKRNWTMESFNPFVVEYLRKKHPEVVRGQLAYNMFRDPECKQKWFIKFLAVNLLFNVIARPDYVAYDICSSKNLSFKLCSKLFKGECVAWTIKNEDDLAYARKYYQQFIFDSFVPKGHR